MKKKVKLTLMENVKRQMEMDPTGMSGWKDLEKIEGKILDEKEAYNKVITTVGSANWNTPRGIKVDYL